MAAAEKKQVKTPAEINALKVDEGKKAIKVSVYSQHGAGLWFEVRSDGVRRFRYRYRLGDKRPDMDLGYYPATKLAEAREKHGQAVALVKQGIDPKSVMENAKAKNIAMPTLSELFEEWKATKSGLKPRTLLDYDRVFACYLGPTLGKVRVCDLTRKVLFSFLEQVGAQEGTRKSLILLNQVLDRAVDLEHIELNPARTIKPGRVGGTAGGPRERWLPKDEIRMLWRALERSTEGAGPVAKGGNGLASNCVTSLAIADCLRLILLTGVRRTEAAEMRFEQLDGDRWSIPETKNNRSHVVTLHPLALEIVERQRALSNGPWVFESISKPGEAVTADAVTRALDRIRVKFVAELEHFHVHDLRRNCVDRLR
ncbi:integrase arm-type DNA-binding domain-containing protein [Aeromonas encheleia]|uniref:tyrosine-type recombinase/integrase n=1 Tax=Aeromonas encheleia TaxID=73010 RepID=UPI001F585300|nr:integrase arm-type DNA-binding domain-containing protein [Aeromonas encheleia]UNP89642.1 integrase arm-type DNA-binding domain-containing protein [Aeromonas encheleia]